MKVDEGIVLGILAAFSVYDLKTKKVPVAAVAVFGAVVMGYRLFGKNGIWELLIGLVPGMLILLLAYVTRESIGVGDGLIVCVIGMFCGVNDTLAVLGMALVMASGVAIVLLTVKRAGRKTELPFLPCLCAGYLLSLLW